MINQNRNDRFRENLDPDLIKAAQEDQRRSINIDIHGIFQFPINRSQDTIDIDYEDVTDVKGFTTSKK